MTIKREWIGTSPINFTGKRKRYGITLSDLEHQLLCSIGDGSLTRGIRRMAYAGRLIAHLDPYSFERALRVLKRFIDDQEIEKELEKDLIFGEQEKMADDCFKELDEYLNSELDRSEIEKEPKIRNSKIKDPKTNDKLASESPYEIYARLTMPSKRIVD